MTYVNELQLIHNNGQTRIFLWGKNVDSGVNNKSQVSFCNNFLFNLKHVGFQL